MKIDAETTPTSGRNMQFLLFAQATSQAERRTGIHRTTIELARWLPTVAPTDVVKWNEYEGQLEFFGRRDFESLFRSKNKSLATGINKFAHRANDRFSNSIDPEVTTWLIFPEIPYHLPNGNETFARIVSQCREYGIRVASIFYDIIPITNASYAEYRGQHLQYVLELSRSDLIIPISQHMTTVLSAFYADSLNDSVMSQTLASKINAVSLPEGRRFPASTADVQDRDTILMLGTVEPRKRQAEVLRAINQLARTDRRVADLNVVVIGSLHPDSARAFHEEVNARSKITYYDYCSQSFVEKCFQRARFTVFASNDEGYGLPIAESVAMGVPCLTADFGSMAEIAEGGGCLSVDVNNIEDLTAGIARLAADDELIERLRGEIALRRLRDWPDYARDVVACIERADPHETADRAQALEAWPERERVVGLFSGIPLELATIGAGPAENGAAIEAPGGSIGAAGLKGTIVKATSDTVALLSAADCAAAYKADALGFDSYDTFKAFVSRAEVDRFAGLLPTKVLIDPDPQQLRSRVWQALCTLAIARSTRLRVEQDEKILMALARRWRGDSARSPALLSIVISTYNRSAFVCENVRWVLSIIKKYGDKINLVVVDNTSTDDSWSKLQSFAGNKQLRLIRNPTNTGMLGNLHVCSTLKLARHVWVTGDDDYIVADALGSVLKILEAEPALPLLMSNFAVYHRGRLMEDDEASQLIAEGTPLAPDPRPSGLYSLREVAAEHDNLFTAVYPIVFRSDVLAACFNYPFTGVPFGDLVESVPTTKLLLDTYAYCPTYWLHAIGIVGNAHNSWTRHRPRWHGVLMPMVFELAREAGVNSAKLYQWARMHNDLLEDALRIAKAENFMIHLDDPGDLEIGYRVFRRPIDVKWVDHPTAA